MKKVGVWRRSSCQNHSLENCIEITLNPKSIIITIMQASEAFKESDRIMKGGLKRKYEGESDANDDYPSDEDVEYHTDDDVVDGDEGDLYDPIEQCDPEREEEEEEGEGEEYDLQGDELGEADEHGDVVCYESAGM